MDLRLGVADTARHAETVKGGNEIAERDRCAELGTIHLATADVIRVLDEPTGDALRRKVIASGYRGIARSCRLPRGRNWVAGVVERNIGKVLFDDERVEIFVEQLER